MADTTPKGFRYPEDSDAPNIAQDIENLATDVDTGLNSYIAKSIVTAQGDLITASGSATPTRLGIGAEGRVLYSNGTAVSWQVDPTSDVVTTAGDLIYGTGADAVARLAIGTAGQVLTVNSGATAPQWGTVSTDSITLLSQTTLSGSSVTVSNINQTYRELIIIVDSPRWDTANDRLQIRLNNSSSAAHMAGVTEDGVNTFTANGITGGSIETGAGDQDRSAGDAIYYLRVANYTATGSGGIGGLKPLHFYGSLVVGDQRSFNRAGAFVSASAITSVVVQTASSRNFQATNPGTLFIYGVK